MDWLGVFLSQVTVLFFMLLGMLVGESAASSIFGAIEGRLRQFIYLMLFVVFLVGVNYLPPLIGIPNPGLYPAILLFGLLGFLSVFISRGLINLMDYFFIFLVGLIYGSEKYRGVGVADNLFSSYLSSRLGLKKMRHVMDEVSLSRDGGKVFFHPKKLRRVMLREGLGDEDFLYVLVDLAGLCPEKAVRLI